MGHTIKLIDYGGWKNCILLTNGVFEAVITTEVGPRIIRYSEVGGENVLYLNEYTAGQVDAPVWRTYGGHRFDYVLNGEKVLVPENKPVSYEIGEDRINFNLDIFEKTGISKNIMIRMCRRGGLEIKETLINHNNEEVNTYALATTQLKSGGLSVLPWEKSKKIMSLIPREEVDYRRINIGKDLIFIEQDEVSKGEFEFGMMPVEKWCSYFNNGNMFIITSPEVEENNTYPDKVNVALRGLKGKVEIEMRSPVYKLGPGEQMTHTTVWNIFSKNYRPKSEEEALAALKDNKYFYEFVRKPVCGLDY